MLTLFLVQALVCFQLDVQIISAHCCQVASVVYTVLRQLVIEYFALSFLFRLVVIRGYSRPYWGQRWGSGLFSCIFKAPQWAL